MSGRYRFCPWCAAPLRSKLVEFFHPHPAFEGEGGRALRVSRYLGGDAEERHVRLSIWDDESTAESVIPLEDAEAERLARFLLEPAGRARSRSVWGRLSGLLRYSAASRAPAGAAGTPPCFRTSSWTSWLVRAAAADAYELAYSLR